MLRRLRRLRDNVFVLADVVLAVARIVGAFTAVTKIKVRIRFVCAATLSALVKRLMLPPHLIGFCVSCPLSSLQSLHNRRAEEQQEVGHARRDGNSSLCSPCDEPKCEERKRQPGEPFRFDGDDQIDPE